jgi:hypothetical protein
LDHVKELSVTDGSVSNLQEKVFDVCWAGQLKWLTVLFVFRSRRLACCTIDINIFLFNSYKINLSYCHRHC